MRGFLPTVRSFPGLPRGVDTGEARGQGHEAAAIVKANRGETVLGGTVAARVVGELRRSPVPRGEGQQADDLSEREVEVLKLVGAGATNREIAARLYITEGTTKNHISKILRKLVLRDRTQAPSTPQGAAGQNRLQV